jgi:hypothetical protein
LGAGTYTVTVTDANGCYKSKTFIITQPGCSLSMDATTMNVTCYGGINGSIDVTVTGAQGIVTYLWNDGATTQDRTGLAAGTYTVTATDAGYCTATITKTITQPTELGVTGITGNVTITGGHDGSINVTVTGGTPPYSYLWNDGATTEDRTGLGAGTYTVTVTDANGCYKSKTFIITQPSCSLSMTATTMNVTCYGGNNGSIDVTVTGAQGIVTYLWNDGATTQDRTGLAAATYTVTATDAGYCIATITKTITQPTELGVTGITGNVTITGGHDGSINVTVTGGTPPYSYLWNDGATTEDRTGLGAGTYTVTVTDANGCYKSKTFIITQPGCSLSMTATTMNVTCYGGNNGGIDVTVTGAQGIVTYLWNDGATTQDRTGLAAGTYTVTATDAGNCTATITKTITQPTDLSLTGLSVNVTITGGHDGSINVTVSGGTPPYSYLWNDGATTEDRTGLGAGTYTVTVTDANGCYKSKAFIITEPQCVCVAPTTFTVDSLSAAAAEICWNPIACATGYILQWKSSDKSKWQTLVIPPGSNCTVFSNQFPLTFDIKVASVCPNGSITPYGPVYVFQTFPSCLPPTGLYTSPVKTTQATAHWTPTPDRTSQTLRYRKTGATAFITKTPGVTASSFVLKPLLPGTTYEWQIRANCVGNDKSINGDFSPLQYFTTLAQKIGDNESEISDIPTMKLYPNPADDNLTIDLKFENSQDRSAIIRVTNLIGQVIEQKTTFVAGNHLVEKITLPDGISDGVYTVMVIVNGNTSHQQIVVQKE